MIAIFYGKRKDQLNTWEQVQGPLAIGLLLALGAAACQAIGLVVSDIVIDVPRDQQPPVLLAALIRRDISAVAFQALVLAGIQAVQNPAPNRAAYLDADGFIGLYGHGRGHDVFGLGTKLCGGRSIADFSLEPNNPRLDVDPAVDHYRPAARRLCLYWGWGGGEWRIFNYFKLQTPPKYPKPSPTS